MRAAEPAAKLAEILSRPLVKVCGLTRAEDVDAVSEAGADMAGFILADSPRRAPAVLPVPETMLSVAVVVGDIDEDSADLVQLYPEENGHRGRDGLLLRSGSPVATVVDRPWLAVDPDHLARAQAVPGRVVLAGGLDADNVRAAIAAVRPWAVDSARGTEARPGIKDPEKVRAFIEAARG
jgi:phosphoribosylanthranilate isomerase